MPRARPRAPWRRAPTDARVRKRQARALTS
jgi:hypothetical protein